MSRTHSQRRVRIDYAAINRSALARLPEILARWLPDGQVGGNEYVARNPTRADRRPGSFKVNLKTGRWADFATDAQGVDPVSLAAYLAGCGPAEAARELAASMAGLGRRRVGRHSSARSMLGPDPSSPLKKASLTGFQPTVKHIAAKAVSPSSEVMRTI